MEQIIQIIDRGVMTGQQAIIDGLDVSRCKYFVEDNGVLSQGVERTRKSKKVNVRNY